MVHEEEVYEDDDDENEEGNWRNDYPDSSGGDDDNSEGEERYGGTLVPVPSPHVDTRVALRLWRIGNAPSEQDMDANGRCWCRLP